MGISEGTGGRWTPTRFGLLGDERLARLAAAGHARAFAVVYERHHQAIYRYCRSILRHDADAQDAVQSTFAAAFAALARGQRDAPIRPWLFRIAHNESVSALRRRRPTAELAAASNASSASVEDQVAERAELHTLLGDLRKLTEQQRSALVMRELSGLSHEEIAIALGTSVGAAKQTIYEARRSLFEFAEGRDMDCDEIRKTVSDADGRALRSRRVRAHLRECSPCRSFAEAIPARRADLRALAPAMPMLAAVGVLEQIAGTTAGHAVGGGAAGLAGAAVGKTAGAALTANALAGAAVVASATIGVSTGVGRLVQAENHPGAHHRAAPVSAPMSTTHSASSLGRPAGSVARARVAVGHRRQAAATASTSTTVPRRRSSPSAGSRTSRRAPVRVVSSPTTTTTGHGSSAIPPGRPATTPGSSAAAPVYSATPGTQGTVPGHSPIAPGNSATRPGRWTAARPGDSENATGNSPTSSPERSATTGRGTPDNAPGRSTTGSHSAPEDVLTGTGTRTTTRPNDSPPLWGNSDNAPGTASRTVPVPSTTDSPPAPSTLSDSAPATTPGSGSESAHAPSEKSSS